MSLVSSKKRIHIPSHVHKPNYLRTKKTTVYEPSMNQKGIHCEGDRFGYVVDWEIYENEDELEDER
ncbi:hypothetical protein ACUNWD_14250 [Sunxiuqinia sp. A32]|uniref:hypothetical protein n=1 Tax=Sunxiuqinia sp. A32 TaxID=3461496 RepID=UPI00404646C8